MTDAPPPGYSRTHGHEFGDSDTFVITSEVKLIEDDDRLLPLDYRFDYQNPKGKWVVYRLYSDKSFLSADGSAHQDELLYVGQTSSFNTRIIGHRSSKAWFGHISSVKFKVFDTEQEALIAEAYAIHDENPKWNRHRAAHVPFADCTERASQSETGWCGCWGEADERSVTPSVTSKQRCAVCRVESKFDVVWDENTSRFQHGDSARCVASLGGVVAILQSQ